MKRKLGILGIMACVGLLYTPIAECAPPPQAVLNVNVMNTPLPVAVTTAYQFAGYAGPTKGDTNGIEGMNLLCQQQFNNENARMATTTEFFGSPQTHNPPENEFAWVRIEASGIVYDQPNNQYMILDKSGTVFLDKREGVIHETMHCYSWTNNSKYYQGAVIWENGVLGNNGCDAEGLVACSRPAMPPRRQQ